MQQTGAFEVFRPAECQQQVVKLVE